MFRLALKNCVQLTNQIVRQYSKTYGALKVSVCGAAGKSGQAVALLLKICPLIDELALYDLCSTSILTTELNHIDTNCKVQSYKRDIKGALSNSHIVVLIASEPNGSDFALNADIVCELTTAIVEHCPKALIAVATNPVNSMVPIVSEVMRHYGVYNRRHVFGVTTLDIMRTNSIVAQKLGIMPETVHVPCIGGHGACTIVPILSQLNPDSNFTDEEKLSITKAVQYSESSKGDKVSGISYLSGALATAQFVISLVRAIKGEKNVVETCLIKSKEYPNMPYLATPIILETDGFAKNLGVPLMNDFEKSLFKTCRACLRQDVQRGEDYVKSKFKQICS